jgi:Pyruvate/2-oxoacid:ferredoxin oxidoreductase delta subunit
VPAKYTIHTHPAAPRQRPVGKLGIVDWREDCSSCHNCVKRACVYGLYRDEYDTLRDEIGYLDYIYQCKGCLNCIQNCTKNLLTRVVNPEYRRLGDSYFTPDIILSTWFQAESGRIPVSGAGYGGPFSGPGFDSMWTDMSEIVRPTRDGIHGREYINTSVDIGRKLPRLAFSDGQLTETPPPLMETPLPIIFDVIPEHWKRGAVSAAISAAAAELGTLVVLPEGDIPTDEPVAGHVVPLLDCGDVVAAARRFAVPLVMIEDRPDVLAIQAALKKDRPSRIVAIRVKATPTAASRVVELTRAGAEVIHLLFDSHGREQVPLALRERAGVRVGEEAAPVGNSPHPNPGPVRKPEAREFGRNWYCKTVAQLRNLGSPNNPRAKERNSGYIMVQEGQGIQVPNPRCRRGSAEESGDAEIESLRTQPTDRRTRIPRCSATAAATRRATTKDGSPPATGCGGRETTGSGSTIRPPPGGSSLGHPWLWSADDFARRQCGPIGRHSWGRPSARGVLSVAGRRASHSGPNVHSQLASTLGYR